MLPKDSDYIENMPLEPTAELSDTTEASKEPSNGSGFEGTASDLNVVFAPTTCWAASSAPNFQDSYIRTLEILRDVLTPHGIQMPSVEKIELDRVNNSDALALAMGMSIGSIARVTATLCVPLGNGSAK